MKRILSILLLLLLCVLPSSAMNITMMGGSVESTTGSCANEPAGDIMVDGFEGSGSGEIELPYNEACYTDPPSWCDWEDPNDVYALSNLSGGKGDSRNCNYGLQFVTTGSNNSSKYRLATRQDSVYASLSLYVDSESLDSYDNPGLLVLQDSTSGDILASIRLYKTGSDLQIHGASSVNDSSKATISLDTWYYIKLYAYNGSSSCSIAVGTTYGGTDILNPASAGVFTCPTPTNSINQMVLQTGSSRTFTYVIGYVALDADGVF